MKKEIIEELDEIARKLEYGYAEKTIVALLRASDVSSAIGIAMKVDISIRFALLFIKGLLEDKKIKDFIDLKKKTGVVISEDEASEVIKFLIDGRYAISNIPEEILEVSSRDTLVDLMNMAIESDIYYVKLLWPHLRKKIF